MERNRISPFYLCLVLYATLQNDSQDLGMLKAKVGIGFFVGYAPDSKGYQIYNKRTR